MSLRTSLRPKTSLRTPPLVAGILILDISDHLPTFCVIKGNACKNCLPRRVTGDMKNFNVECFCEDISGKLAFMPLKSDDDPNLDLIFLSNTMTDTANTYAPLKALSRREMKLMAKSWITKGLLKLITTKNKLFQQC